MILICSGLCLLFFDECLGLFELVRCFVDVSWITSSLIVLFILYLSGEFLLDCEFLRVGLGLVIWIGFNLWFCVMLKYLRYWLTFIV